MSMMMHHDTQPLYSRDSHYGLLKQVRLLRKAGAVSLQVLMIVPSPGSKSYDETFSSGQVYERVGDRRVEPYMHDGNYVIASHDRYPWRKQINILTAYLYFYNPLQLMRELCQKTTVGDKPWVMQLIGMLGLIQNIRRTSGWAARLMFGKIVRADQPPSCQISIRRVNGGTSSHASPNVGREKLHQIDLRRAV